MTIPDFPMRVTAEEDGSMTIEWDKDNIYTAVFNDYTEDDFTKLMIDACKKVLGEDCIEE